MRQRPSRRSIKTIAVLMCMAAGGPAHGASQVAQINATVVKPLTVSWVQNLNLGTVVLGPGTWSNATVGISRAGVFTCGSASVTCSGATQVAKYNVTGTNNQVARISAPNVTMVNQSDSTKTLTLVVDSPGTVAFTNSGSQGVTFSLGGAITLNSTTTGGTYAGTFNVTVDY